jgi:hypothetical protein
MKLVLDVVKYLLFNYLQFLLSLFDDYIDI